MPSQPPSWSIPPPPPRTPRPALNAIALVTLETDPAAETAEQQTVRHLRLCQELIERGMHLARIAADRAEQDFSAPPPAPMPGSSAAAIEQAEARARLRVPNHAATFARLSRAVRQTIALQAHIKAGRPFARLPQPANTDDRPRAATPAAHPPDRARPRLDAADPPDWLLPIGPDGTIPVETVFQTIDNSLSANLPAAAAADGRPADEPGPIASTHLPSKPDHPKSECSPANIPARLPGRRW